MKKVLAGILVILIVVGVAGGIYYINSPYKVLYDFKKEIDAGNYEEALEYVEPTLRNRIKTAMEIEGTAFGFVASKFDSNIPADIVSKLSDGASSIEWEVKDIGKESSRKHYVCLEGDYGADKNISLDLVIKRTNGKWYIAGVENIKLVTPSE